MNLEALIEPLLLVAPPVAKALRTYFGDRKNVKPSELQVFYFAKIVEGNIKIEELLKGMSVLLTNHLDHSTEMWKEVINAFKDLRIELIRKGAL